MIDYDSFLRCHLFFRYFRGSKRVKRHSQSLENSKLDSAVKFFKENTTTLKGSNDVARKIAVAKKSHNISELMLQNYYLKFTK